MSHPATPAALDPDAARLLEGMAAAAAGRPAPATPAEAIAAGRAGYRAIVPLAGEAEPVAEVRDLTVPGPGGALALRLYRPANFGGGALLHLHGGGFVSGDLDTHDRPLRALANRSGRLVVAADYRLAPEHPHPAALEDARAALRWLAAEAPALGVDCARIAVGGDSAGGLLAAALALAVRDAGGPAIERLVLIYPNADLTPERGARWPSVAENDGKVLDRTTMDRNAALYVGAADSSAPTLSPALATDLSRLPPAVVVTGGHDPLRDEGAALAARMAEAGGAVEHWHYAGQIHGFFQLGGAIVEGRALIERLGSALRGR